MARVAGLRPFTEDRPQAAGRFADRFQVKADDSVPALRPAASPVETVGRPAQPGQDDNLIQLANSLAKFNPALTHLGSEIQDTNKQEAAAAAAAKIGGMTFEERQAAVKNGLPEFADPWFRAAFMKAYGTSYATWRGEQNEKDYLSERPENLDEWLTERRKADLEALGGDKFAISGYVSANAPLEHSLRQTRLKEDQKQIVDQTNQGVIDGFRNIVTAGQGYGADAATIHAQLQARMRDNQTLLRLPFRDQNKLILSLASEYADKGNSALVNELMDGKRGDLPPLSQTPEFTASALQIKAHALQKQHELANTATLDQQVGFADAAGQGKLDEQLFKDFVKRNPDIYKGEQVEALILHNRAARRAAEEKARVQLEKVEKENAFQAQMKRIRDNDVVALEHGALPFLGPAKYLNREGHEAELSAEARKKDAVQEYMARSPIIAKQRGETPEDTFAREVDVLTRNGAVNEQWKAILAAGAPASVGPTVTGEKLPPALETATALYNKLWAANPRLLANHMDKENYDFYEAYRVASTELKLDPQQAYLTANTVTRDPAQFNSPYWSKRFDDIDTAAKGINGWFDGNSSVDNLGTIGTEVARVAKLYSKLGLSNKDALKQAADRVKASYTDINGHYVFTGDRSVPPNFKDMVVSHLSDYVAKFGEQEGVDARDLTIRPLDNGVGSYLVTRKDGSPVAFGPGRVFTLDMLVTREKQRQADVRTKIADEAEHRYDPWYTDNFVSVGPFKLGGFSADEQKKIDAARERQLKEGSSLPKPEYPPVQNF